MLIALDGRAMLNALVGRIMLIADEGRGLDGRFSTDVQLAEAGCCRTLKTKVLL